MKEKIYIAADHAGYELKSYLIDSFKNINWIDLGTYSNKSVDYPDYTDKLCDKLKVDTDIKGVLVCGTGIGMSIRANRYNHIRAALCTTPDMAKATRLHNNANVLCLGSRVVQQSDQKEILHQFLTNSFEGGRHQRRVEKLSARA